MSNLLKPEDLALHALRLNHTEGVAYAGYSFRSIGKSWELTNKFKSYEAARQWFKNSFGVDRVYNGAGQLVLQRPV